MNIDNIITIKFSELENLILKNKCLLKVELNQVLFEFFINIKESNENLLILGSGAFDYTQHKLPSFHRYTWADDLNATSIYYNDPTLYLGNINLGWGYGEKEHYYLKDIALILDKLILKLNKTKDRTFFYGSSGGGYMSLILSGLIKGSTALVNNPQTNLVNYSERHLKNLFDTVYGNDYDKESIIKENIMRLDVYEFFKKINYVPNIVYKQNILCQNDIFMQLVPFLKKLSDLNLNPDKEIIIEGYFNKDLGHNPLNKIETLHFINSNMI